MKKKNILMVIPLFGFALLSKEVFAIEVPRVNGNNGALLDSVSEEDIFSVDVITNETTVISGRAKAGSLIKLYIDNVYTGKSTFAKSSGEYMLSMGAQPFGTIIAVECVVDGVSKFENRTVLHVMDELIVPSISINTTTIEGKSTPGATIEVSIDGVTPISTAKVNQNGVFKLEIPKQPVGTNLQIKATKSGYETLIEERTVLNVYTEEQRLSFRVDDYTKYSEKITGWRPLQSRVEPYLNGEKLGYRGGFIFTGEFDLEINKQPVGTKIDLKMYKDGYEPVWYQITVLDVFENFEVGNVTDTSTSVKGRITPGAYIKIFDKDEQLGLTTKADAGGFYEVKIPQQKFGKVLRIEASKENYQTISKSMRVLKEFKTFSVKNVLASSVTISGTGDPGAEVAAFIDDKRIGPLTTVDSKGNYEIAIPKQKPGTVIELKMTKTGYHMVSKEVIVLDEFKTFTLKTTLTPSTTAVYGTGLPGSKVGIYDKNGKRLAITTVNSKGNYKLVIPKQKVGTVLTLKQAKSGYLTASKNITVLNEFKTFTLKTNPTSSTTAIYGTGVAGSKVGIYTSSGKRLAITTVNSKGNYKLVIPKQKAGTKLVIKQAKSGYLTLAKNVTVLNQFKTFTYDTPTVSTTAIYGKGVAGAKVGIYTTNGKRLAITTVNSKGNYKLVIPKQKAGTVLTLKQAKSGYLTASKNVTVLDEFKTFTLKTMPTVSTTAIYGTGVAGAKVGVYNASGKRLAITTVNSKGNYKLVIPKQKAGTVVEVKMAKSGYQTLSQKVKVIK